MVRKTLSLHQGKVRWAFIRVIVQLANLRYFVKWAQIDRHTVWLQVTLHAAAPFIGHFFGSNHVTLECSVYYWLLEYQDAVVFCRKHCKKIYKISSGNIKAYILESPDIPQGEIGSFWLTIQLKITTLVINMK